MGRQKGNRLHTEFIGRPIEDVARIARDPNAPAELRRKAREHEKALGERNRQKRKNKRHR